jgi:CBS domain-containing protein
MVRQRSESMDMRQLTVADVMTIDPVLINADASLEEAANLLRSRAISGLPVVDAGGALLGVISQTDLLAIGDSAIGRAIRAQATGIRVGELMTSPAVTVPMTSSLHDGARLMRDGRVHRLVVIDDAGHPVGVLSAIDFVALFAES